MSRYNRFEKRDERPWKIHPIWRGIGCIWLILLPVMSYAGAWTFTRENFKNNWLPLTDTLRKPLVLPVYDFPFLSFPLNFNILIRWIPGQPLYNVDALFFIGFLFLGFGIISVIYALMFRTLAPARGPFDAPEIERSRPVKRRR